MRYATSKSRVSLHIAKADGLPRCNADNGSTRWIVLDELSDFDFESACHRAGISPCKRCLNRVGTGLALQMKIEAKKQRYQFLESMGIQVPSECLRGYIYLAWAINTKRYKIGYTNNPDSKIHQLNSGQSPFPVEFIHLIPSHDMERDERRMHKTFAHYCVYKEWFELPGDAVEVIKCIQEFPCDSDSTHQVQP